ncbi:MAG TPA: hypothetical protein VNO20_04880 [Solirubrobacterales bacterium]|nr:hypothetical protein [Solirubrobacterales bacterium]
MEKALDRPAVNVAPRKAQPGLALLLALLAVPGSTLAWDLPSGGLWIGLPLAIAAIAIGIRAHRLLGGSKLAVAAIVIAGLMILQMAIWTFVSLVS